MLGLGFGERHEDTAAAIQLDFKAVAGAVFVHDPHPPQLGSVAEDRGKAFNPLDAGSFSPATSLEEARTGGYGLALVRMAAQIDELLAKRK